ncbi:TPA: metal-dependent transcriptional regulator [Streptococcus agalactiae]|uniref:metal-dependent transcriptional regulator n=1 Tax=Streptococcus agalactiae TaxID=1311 RepID=UPI00143099CE|nr:metal-dependent transcriptional regulator [Streptococcus agalactiae]NJK27081.1 metal-dependent transcriptional regulator [Streptococcus agalactiae]
MTPNKADYLKCIHELGEKNNKISNKKIAEMMQVSAPAVSEMIKKMISEQLIVKDKDLGYYLTKQGLLVVSDLYRKHRLVEVFLVNHLHYTADDIHEEAEVLEHTVSTTFVDQLEKLLDFPQFCPHGGTIPKKGEFLVEINQMTLDQISQLGTYVISRVHDDFQLLKYLEQHRLHINDIIELTQIDPYAKTYHITYNDENLTIPERIASQIYVSAT